DDINLARQFLAANGFRKKIKHVVRFAATFDDAVNAVFLVAVRLNDLPAARTADDDLEIAAKRTAFDRREQFLRVMRIDRLTRRSEDRGVDARRESHAQRVVSRERDDARIGADEFMNVLR